MDGLAWFFDSYGAYVGLGAGGVVLAALVAGLVRANRRMRRLEERMDARSAKSHVVTIPETWTPVEPDQRQPVPAAEPAPDYRITRLGDTQPEPVEPEPVEGGELEPRLDRGTFYDLLLRESVIRMASLGHGVRRVLDPATRNRIRFEVRRETKRARKQRRAETREAVRQLRDDQFRESA